MTTNWNTFLATALCAAACSQPGLAQVAPSAILVVDVENYVQYMEDTSDLSKFVTNPNVTPAVLPKNLNFVLAIGDIVAVNGQSVQGTLTRNARNVFLRTAPEPGQAIAALVRNAFHVDTI